MLSRRLDKNKKNYIYIYIVKNLSILITFLILFSKYQTAMFLNFYHLSGSIKYRGWVPRRKLPKNLQRFVLNSNQKLYDVGNLCLSYFHGYRVYQFDKTGNLWDSGIVKNGKFKRNRKHKRTKSDVESFHQNSTEPSSFAGVNTYETVVNVPPLRIDESIFQGYFPESSTMTNSENSTSSSTDEDSYSDNESDESTWSMGSIYDQTYEGEEYMGLPHGKGILYDIQSDIPVYVGHFLNGSFHRKGIAYVNGKKIYNGEWRNGKRHGYGKSYNEKNELLFEGIWRRDLPYFGKIYGDNKKVIYDGLFKNYEGFFLSHQDFLEEKIYKGFWKNGKKDGFGSLTKYGQILFEGNWKNGKMHGRGKIYDDGDLLYDGELKENQRDGVGNLFNFRGELIYEGEWKNDKRNGYGREDNCPHIYKGQWKNDQKEGYGIFFSYSHNSDNVTKRYSGMWKNNECYGEGVLFWKNGMISREGCFDKNLKVFGREYYDTGHLKYEGEYENDVFHGSGRLFYMNQTLCFEGQFCNGHFYSGTFYDKDGSVHKSFLIDGDSYCYGVALYDDDDCFAYRGHFKNGKFHGKGASSQRNNGDYIYDGNYKDGKYHGQGTYYRCDNTKVSGTFLNGFFFDEEHQCLKFLSHLDKEEDKIIYKGTMKDEKYYNGVEYIVDHLDSYRYPKTIRSVIWKDGVIFDENAERIRLRRELSLLNYLETKNKKKLKTIYKEDYLAFLKNKYDMNDDYLLKKTKKQLLCEIEKKRLEIVSIMDESVEAEFDLFGNEIVTPVKGFDGETYDESSMKYLFQRDEEDNFVNIKYHYDENHERQPTYPIMSNGKKLQGYIKGETVICEFPFASIEFTKSEWSEAGDEGDDMMSRYERLLESMQRVLDKTARMRQARMDQALIGRDTLQLPSELEESVTSNIRQPRMIGLFTRTRDFIRLREFDDFPEPPRPRRIHFEIDDFPEPPRHRRIHFENQFRNFF